MPDTTIHLLAAALANPTIEQSVFFRRRGNEMLFDISKDGKVRIDWRAVEATIADPAGSDPTSLAFARIMVAVRNGAWKPL